MSTSGGILRKRSHSTQTSSQPESSLASKTHQQTNPINDKPIPVNQKLKKENARSTQWFSTGGVATVLLLLVLVVQYLSYLFLDQSIEINRSRRKSEYSAPHFEVVFNFNTSEDTAKYIATIHSITNPPDLSELIENEEWNDKEDDFGGLDILFLRKSESLRQSRVIYHEYDLDRGYGDIKQDDDDTVLYYYAFDDDIARNPYHAWDDDTIQLEKHCRRTSWHRDLPINCNNLHEFDIQGRFAGGGTKFLGEGVFRETYWSENLDGSAYVFKVLRWKYDFTYYDFEYMRMDAIVAERLTWSPRIVDIYGYCGSAMINQAMENGTLEDYALPTWGKLEDPLEDLEELVIENEVSATKKLEYSLDMAEAVSLLHGFPDGVIVHDDIQLSQFLFDSEDNLKLNDFNRAEIMLWNEKDEEYCRYKNTGAYGEWRAPEEFHDLPLNEQIDIWSLGNNMYTLLTGLTPFPDITEDSEVQDHIRDGETGYIDPRFHERSFAEKTLAEIIPLCWKYEPDERIDIFELVKVLREAVEKNSILQRQENENE